MRLGPALPDIYQPVHGAGGDPENCRIGRPGFFSRSRRRAADGAGARPSRKAGERKAATWRAGITAATTCSPSNIRWAANCRWSERYFNIGPVEMSGSSTTIKQTSVTLGPSMRFVADLANWDGSLNNIDIGRVRADSIAALQGPVGRVLCGTEFSDAIRQGGGEGHAGGGAEVAAATIEHGCTQIGVHAVSRGRLRDRWVRAAACLARCLWRWIFSSTAAM